MIVVDVPSTSATRLSGPADCATTALIREHLIPLLASEVVLVHDIQVRVTRLAPVLEPIRLGIILTKLAFRQPCLTGSAPLLMLTLLINTRHLQRITVFEPALVVPRAHATRKVLVLALHVVLNDFACPHH